LPAPDSRPRLLRRSAQRSFGQALCTLFVLVSGLAEQQRRLLRACRRRKDRILVKFAPKTGKGGDREPARSNALARGWFVCEGAHRCQW